MKFINQPGFAKTALVGTIIALTYLTINTVYIFTSDQPSEEVSMSQIVDK